ncbi:hypothetical protein [Streptomyces sp. NPDC058466]|uniref:hypothetical protein n=1 Tax=Streptomyces sp. NPDC058466 TaxID=3346512 RepID=UPI0036476895
MDIRPVDLPDLRTDLVAAFESAHEQPWQRSAESIGVPASVLASHAVQGARDGEMYHVSSDMTELAMSAAGSLPEFEVSPEDFPSPVGLMLLGGPGLTAAGELAAVQGLVWFCGAHSAWFYPVRATAEVFTDRKHRAQMLGRVGKLITLGDAAACQYGRTLPSSNTTFALQVFRTAWLLMQQTLALATDVEPDRATRKRLRRAGYEPKPIRVIELRRPAHSGSGDGSREFHHQWIVRGHWRQQWYPAREVHRPVWIAPHIKGPEGAPLIGGEKVYAWKR